MNEVPHLKKAYETFHAKGFEIYGVSLDTDLTRWENTIGEQDMNWINVAQKKRRRIRSNSALCRQFHPRKLPDLTRR